ncbi:hypothetical protein [Thermofilum pendens]|uniref:Uncharacterized protein n=1 Tax=Thermofilum pendens (strain DSM 2475 / Hrk 5) TaxID=368408 RepID=A1RZM7_THEPD|nr:hypothetical protein [Thermofilum pendens]ABL78657.1 hypothetical protein Tpen_1259 [Thermofilum pendens Hrk 5]
MSSIRFGEVVSGRLSDHFYCWVRKPLDKGEVFAPDDPSKYWVYSLEEEEYTRFKNSFIKRPKGVLTLSLRSRKTFRYGFFQLAAALPSWGRGSPMLWFGFENEDLFGGGVAHFLFSEDELYAFAGAWGSSVLQLRLPVDVGELKRGSHVFTVRVYEGLAVWSVDSEVKGVAVLADTGQPVVAYEGAPYSAGVTGRSPPPSMGVLIDIDGGPGDEDWVWWNVNPWHLRVAEGGPRPFMALRLYEWGTGRQWEGFRASGRLVSQPVPTLGRSVTLTLAPANGMLRVEALTLSNRWVTVYERRVQGVARVYLDGGDLFSRFVYEPEGEQAISVAEVTVT